MAGFACAKSSKCLTRDLGGRRRFGAGQEAIDTAFDLGF
jgi:hypothetical protein